VSRSRGARSKWFLAAVGCFSIVILTVAAVGIALLWASSSHRRLGDPAPAPAGRAISLADAAPAEPAGPGTAVLSGAEFPDSGRQQPVALVVALSEGRFEVVPGEPGSDITIEGTFASNYYDLVETREEAAGVRRIAIRLRPRAGWLTRIMAGLTHIDSRHPNRLRVSIPPDVPIDLDLRLDSGESEVELGGLLLTGLSVDLTRGSFRLGIEEPLAAELQQASLHLGMGDGRVSGLGNARAGRVALETGMGGFRVDLGGAWRPAQLSEIQVSHKMGDLTLTVPSTVRLARDSSSAAVLGGINGRLDPDDFASEDDLEAPILRVDTTASMGGVNLRRYR
jgi:hypothetical protein